MSDTAPLKLVRPDDTSDILPFERRRSRRNSLSGRVTALRSTAQAPESRNRICSLQLLDISDSGLGAVSQEPVDPDLQIAVFFPPHGHDRGFDLYGRVVRCQPHDRGHEIGIQFDHPCDQLRSAS